MSNVAHMSLVAPTRRKGFNFEDPGTDDGADCIGETTNGFSSSTAVEAPALTLVRNGDGDGPLSHSLSCEVGLRPVSAGGRRRAAPDCRSEGERPTDPVKDCLHARGTFVDARRSHFA